MITQTTNNATISHPAVVATNATSSTAKSNRSFEAIINDYWSDPDKGSSLDYLNSLSGRDLKTVGRAHNFADPTPRLAGITTEGANNLLRAKGETIDENHDGLDQIGEARTWRFPNSNTPPEVAAAWEEATEGMEDFEALLLATAFMPAPMITTNPVTGRQQVISPGDEGYVNPKMQSGYSFMDTVVNKLRSLDDPSNPPADIEFYNKQKAFYKKLLEAFENNNVA